jgi:hypothetical protein
MPQMTRRRRWLLAGGIVLVFLLWRAGNFDHALYNVGLNAKDCARNGLGATFCGRELDHYRQQVEPLTTQPTYMDCVKSERSYGTPIGQAMEVCR